MNVNSGIAVDLYLDLLKRSLTSTLYEDEPDHDNSEAEKFVVKFALHYIQGDAVTMQPLARLDNTRACIQQLLADEVPGDVIETGVWRGGGCIFMRACLNVLGGADRTVWVADSFEGLPKPDLDSPKELEFHNSTMMQKLYLNMAASLEEVRRNFAAYRLLDDNVKFLKGWFKDTLPGSPIERLALMRLDGDYYVSTRDALAALYPRLSPGGFVIIDDYGEDLWTDCRKAVDEFRQAEMIDAPFTRVDSKCVFWRKA